MEQYINKSVIIAEIEKRQNEEVNYNEDGSFASCGDQIHYSALESFKNLVNDLAKNTDLEKTLTGFQNRYAYENSGELPSAIEIAEYFFELGLKAK